MTFAVENSDRPSVPLTQADLCAFRCTQGFPGGSEVKASACNVGDLGSIPGSGRSPGEGNDNPLQYSCLENPMDGGAWWATVHGVAKSRTRLGDFTHSLTQMYTNTLCDLQRLPVLYPPSIFSFFFLKDPLYLWS